MKCYQVTFKLQQHLEIEPFQVHHSNNPENTHARKELQVVMFEETFYVIHRAQPKQINRSVQSKGEQSVHFYSAKLGHSISSSIKFLNKLEFLV